ncbi:MAG TPA: choice-of-anchor tandem repeat GloVer-containing protein [Rhizomicrobium sp.]|jgi:uncharacterized repeat protein (TIGR03803 family)|nr:choice-of-anchor tandem repeat GloVer-containing protein [Rhizomicrobium sp.]
MSKLVNYRARLRAGVALPLAAVAALAAGGLSTALAKGVSYEVLYNFAGSPNDGALPDANLMKDKTGNLYGTTVRGGSANYGTVFEVTTGGTETVLYSFQYGSDGYYPDPGTPIEDGAGNLYGTCQDGGAYGHGTVFKLAPNGTETALYSFGSFGTDGVTPFAGLIADAKGNLYSTTENGGADGWGTVFELAPDGTETVLYSFAGYPSDGAYPYSSPIRIGGNLYGVTTGGGAGNSGTVFELVKGKKGAWTEKVLYSFTGGADGAGPTSDLIHDSAGSLYGTATSGGANGYGDVFKLAPDDTFTVLYSFQGGSDGENPSSAPRLAKNGNLYGTTYYGGANGGYGTVYELAPDGTETVLHAFAGPPNDGAFPNGAGHLTDIGGYLYGTTFSGGANSVGTVFRIKP